MSYRPPTKSSYDDELTEDGWSSTYSQTHQPGSSGYQATPANYNRTQNANNSNTTSPQSKNSFQDDPANLGSSITQEDILFMRSWQKDSFVKRVIPLSAASWGALYMFNRHKQLPHTISRYVAVGMGAYILGKFSYKNEFKRRLADSKSNTPYMQALRKAIGMNPVSSGDGFDQSSGSYGSLAGNDSSDWNATGLTGDLHLSGTGEGVPHPSFGNLTDNSFGSENPPSKATSYDELRAKNRGLVR